MVLAVLDPLTAEDAVRLAEIATEDAGRSLCVVIQEISPALLPSTVRMTLAAALSSVQLVSCATKELFTASWGGNCERVRTVDLTEQGLRSSQDFVDLVIAKQQTVAV